MKKIIIHKRDDTGTLVLVSVIKALFPECEVEVFSEGRLAMRHSLSMVERSQEAKEEERR